LFSYILKRFFLIVPTLFGVLLLNFFLLKMLPGNPLDYFLAKAQGVSFQEGVTNPFQVRNDALISEDDGPVLSGVYGIDQSLWTQFTTVAIHYMSFDFGKSYFQDRTVLALIQEHLPVSLSLGFFSLLISYLVSIFLGIYKATHDGSFFDTWSNWVLTFFYAMPNFLLAVLLMIFFAGGFYEDWFPLQGLISDNWEGFTWTEKILDYLHHLVLPVTTIVLGGVGNFTFFIKSAFLEELKKPYIQAVYARGGSSHQAIYRHALKHVMVLIVSHFPQSFTRIFFMNTLVVEMVFSLNGMGFLLFQSILRRDYPVVLGTLFIFTLLGLLVQIIVDGMMIFWDPRMNFKGENRG
jgi:microcin C transport system permease protein